MVISITKRKADPTVISPRKKSNTVGSTPSNTTNDEVIIQSNKRQGQEDIEEEEEEEDEDEEDVEEPYDDDDDEEEEEDLYEDDDDDFVDEIEMIAEPKDIRRKIPIKYIDNRTRRQVTFAKRRHGIMKKAYELSVLTGANILLLILGHSGLVYTFSTPKLEPIITEKTGKDLIRTCLNSPSPSRSPSTTPS